MNRLLFFMGFCLLFFVGIGYAQAQTPCVNGMAGIYPCWNIDLLAHLPLDQIGGSDKAADLWGWTDSVTGQEIAIITRSNGTAFVDVSDPVNPIFVADLPSAVADNRTNDVKVIGDYAFRVSEASGFGVQVYDLNQLRSISPTPATVAPSATYGAMRAHNIAYSDSEDYVYLLGVRDADVPCNSGVLVLDVSDPLNLSIVTCFDAGGYVHDAQCIDYQGPDGDYVGREICALFQPGLDGVSFIDITDKSNISSISTVVNSATCYSHQGVFTEDFRFVLANDEWDEYCFGWGTRTYFYDVTDLDNPFLSTYFEFVNSVSPDHNLFIKDGYVYEANYVAGVQVLDIRDLNNGTIRYAATFDLYPESNALGEHNGAWTVYPYFDSGILVASSIRGGLFVLQPNLVDAPTSVALRGQTAGLGHSAVVLVLLGFVGVAGITGTSIMASRRSNSEI